MDVDVYSCWKTGRGKAELKGRRVLVVRKLGSRGIALLNTGRFK